MKRVIVALVIGSCLLANSTGRAQQALQSQDIQLTQDLHKELGEKAEWPSFSLERIVKKSEIYKAVIQRTERNKRIAWFTGGATIVGTVLYIVLSRYHNAQQKNANNGPADENNQRISRRRITRDEAFQEWWEQERKKNTTLWGGVQWGVYEGVRIALVTFVVGLLLKIFDHASGSFSSIATAILGESAEEIFNRVTQHFAVSFESLYSSLRTLLTELEPFVSEHDQKAAIPSFFFDVLLSDVQALALHLEEIMALVFAVMAIETVDNPQLEHDTVAVCQAVNKFIDHSIGLVEHRHHLQAEQVKRESMLVVKKLALSVERYLATAKNVLFKAG